MPILNKLEPKLYAISEAYTENFNNELKAIFECLDTFEDEYLYGQADGREKNQMDKNLMTTLESINEDDDESNKTPDDKSKQPASTNDKGAESRCSSDSNSEPQRLSHKRCKNDVDGISSPEQDKRVKRNASVKAQSIISKQVNVNLTQKLRREEPEKSQGRRRNDDKENEPDFANIQIKQEKISLPPEPMDLDSLPIDIAMPPPVAPVPKPRKALTKEKSVLAKEKSDSEEETSTRSRRNTKLKQVDSMPPPPVPAPATRSTRANSRSTQASSRSTRASSRASSRSQQADVEEQIAQPTAEPRPKRTRAKKKASDTSVPDTEKDTAQTEVNGTASPSDKPRPKRTRRGQKAADKVETTKPEESKPAEPEPVSTLKLVPVKEELVSPILPQKKPPKETKKKEVKSKIPVKDATPENKNTRNTQVTVDTCNRKTIVLETPHTIMDTTFVLENASPEANDISEDNSIMTDDNSDVHTPPKSIPAAQPTSAVKEKVQQFEELASGVTRTKTRAMAKKDKAPENRTPSDKVSTVLLSAETLSKMNNLIFNGKTQNQVIKSAWKPRANVPVAKNAPASASKVSAIKNAKEVEETLRQNKEDARKKKEALLEAKREQQRRKREEKMAAAAAAREAADRERLAQLEAAARERLEKQALVDQGKLERIKEAERKKLENARKAAETEERRRAEDFKQKQKLEDEQRREAARRKQLEEAEADKKEAALIEKEIEKRQKEYLERCKIKQDMEDRMHKAPLKLTPLKSTPPKSTPPMDPVYMTDGFQYLHSDEEDEDVQRPVPAWSTTKARKQQLLIQSRVAEEHVYALFAVRVHSPDLCNIFPNIDRSLIKRTSSAVWRTPPNRLPDVAE